MFLDEDFRLKAGLAEMLKGGVIMDVTNAEQAKIAEDAGATSVMALERVPADIRKEGGVARMASIAKIREIMETVHIPVMAKAPHRTLHGSKGSRGAEGRLHRRKRSPYACLTKRTTSTNVRFVCLLFAAREISVKRCGASAKAPR